MYGPVAAAHLKAPRNLGKLADADGVGVVDDLDSETFLTVYLKLRRQPDGLRIVKEASFRAFGCGGCIITGSIVTELATGRTIDSLTEIDGATIERALESGLPAEQRYCADLAAGALRLACEQATR